MSDAVALSLRQRDGVKVQGHDQDRQEEKKFV